MKYFKELIKNYKVSKESQLTKECLNTEIKAIEYDSRLIKKNYLFVAIKGLKDDGHKYIESAINNKASIIIYDNTADKNFIKKLQDNYKDVHFVAVKNPRECLAYISAKFF
ncbi:Mur ligase domain-containing protein [Brachyspira hampsonii]|uniref:Mur ligase domain-containing protein n=1 Tax=Brachyspira hampsonii TaxID=1287055 RepID=UPI002159DC01